MRWTVYYPQVTNETAIYSVDGRKSKEQVNFLVTRDMNTRNSKGENITVAYFAKRDDLRGVELYGIRVMVENVYKNHPKAGEEALCCDNCFSVFSRKDTKSDLCSCGGFITETVIGECMRCSTLLPDELLRNGHCECCADDMGV